jgi:maltose-binding protein MalE
VEIQWWHAMGGALGEWVNDLAKGYNESQKEYKVVPTFKGSYPETLTAGIAAFRAGTSPTSSRCSRSATATMMASKGAIVPVGKVMKDSGLKFDQTAYVSAVAGYYTAPNGQMLSMPFNSSTTIFYYNKDAFRTGRASIRTSRRSPGPRSPSPRPSSRPPATSARSPPAGSAGPARELLRLAQRSSSRPRATA